LRPRERTTSGRLPSFNLDDEKVLRDLAKMKESSANVEIIASARLALAAKLAQSGEKDKRKESKKHAMRVAQTNTVTISTELGKIEKECGVSPERVQNIRISERLVRASESFLADEK